MKMKTIIIGLFALAIVVTGATRVSAELDMDRLLLHWPCDDGGGDTLEDASGNGFDADIGGAHDWEDGQFGGAVSLQNTSATVIGDVVSSTAATGEITLACWVLLREHAAYSGVLSIANPACGASCCYRFLVNPGFNPFWNGGEHVDKNFGNFTFELDTWYHCVLTVAGGMDKIYIDGELIGEMAGIDPPEFDEVTVLLGAGEGPGTHTIEDGLFDEAMIWDKELDEDEIKTVMEGYKVFSAVDANGKLAAKWGELKTD